MGEVSILREIKSLVCAPHWRYPRRERRERKPQETQFSLPIPKSPWSHLTQGRCSCRGAFQILSGTESEDFCPNQGNLIAQQFKKLLDFSHTINSPYIIVEKYIRKARSLWMKRNWTQLESSHHRCDFQNFLICGAWGLSTNPSGDLLPVACRLVQTVPTVTNNANNPTSKWIYLGIESLGFETEGHSLPL